jgi:hypothetical protein
MSYLILHQRACQEFLGEQQDNTQKLKSQIG